MRPASLEPLSSFALLGPGFSGSDWLLLTDLRAEQVAPQLVYLPFEAPGYSWRGFGGQSQAVSVQLDAPPTSLAASLSHRGYRETVERIRDAIAAGDVYQVCYTLRAQLGAVNGAQLLSALCRAGVPRFAAWVRLPDGEEFVSASPELFFEIDGPRIRSEPMKGTARPDLAGRAAFEASEKERSELAMITDLVRNDLAQVCQPRTVRVACDRRTIELPYAVQTVSEVVGELPPKATPLDALAVLHPGGSVTGTPKLAALEMIRAIEASPRGAYCGTLGLWQGPRAIFSLLIRTAMRQPSGWIYGVGSGIVYDSDADKELDELHVKLGALT